MGYSMVILDENNLMDCFKNKKLDELTIYHCKRGEYIKIIGIVIMKSKNKFKVMKHRASEKKILPLEKLNEYVEYWLNNIA